MRPIHPLGLLFGCVATTFGVYAPRLIPHENFTAIVAYIGGQIDQLRTTTATPRPGPVDKTVVARSRPATTITSSKTSSKKLWADALVVPGSDSGHWLELREFTPSNGESEFCRDGDENWHDHVPTDTLELFIDQREGIIGTMSSTIGYEADSTGPGRHQLFFDPDLTFNPDAGSDDSFVSPDAVARVAHELGHSQFLFCYVWPSPSNNHLVLGLEHEHQRSDRKPYGTPCQAVITDQLAGDKYVDFQCDKLAYYDNPMALCDKITNCDIEQVCKVWDLARGFKFIHHRHRP